MGGARRQEDSSVIDFGAWPVVLVRIGPSTSVPGLAAALSRLEAKLELPASIALVIDARGDLGALRDGDPVALRLRLDALRERLEGSVRFEGAVFDDPEAERFYHALRWLYPRPWPARRCPSVREALVQARAHLSERPSFGASPRRGPPTDPEA